ncbi:hypothetical protein [Planococcus shenhongbingii]|uniref:Uncharacterized protein n=1 Tax=Planococcus shenhongbingii TaxID=3058398 RepID=A0ABT8N9T6_9BACL|nr:hypothetical protein [Planococcus sp. N017]MDN7244649.1 hypothetical protein [Planococcus sp. N017]
MELVKQAADPRSFRNRTSTLATVNDLLGHADSDRKYDVSKMVLAVVSNLERQKTQPAGIAAYVSQKKKNRKPLAFVKK